jgi:sigma-B regulation protein RsbU (phosphoserine phosphatase)
MENELHVARSIQMALLPKIFPPYPERKDIDMYATIVPAKEVGGDLYDFFIRDEKIFFCIGDVSGKGIPASLVMAVTRSLFRTVAAHEKSPQRIVTAMNESMSDTNENNMFVTLFCGVLDLTTGHLRFCNAGHNAPYLLYPDGTSVPLEVNPNLPLAVMEGMVFAEQEMDLPSGTGLFMFTDGLNEAENEDHDQFGNERLQAQLSSSLSATEQVQVMTRSVDEFVDNAPQSDDLTILYIKYMNENAMDITERHLILHNDIQQIPQLAEFVENVADIAHLDVGLTMSLNLALEEAVSNVIMYAYPKGADGLVDIEAIIRKEMLEFVITDSGTPFDPTVAPEADVSLSLEDRPIGGLGIFLVKNIMDTVNYERTDGKNILKMTKKLV